MAGDRIIVNASYKESKVTEEQLKKIDELIKVNDSEVPDFYEEGICNSFYIPVEDDEIQVFHHKPKNPITKRPILFVPGFNSTLWSWKDFTVPLFEKCEYYFLETREKTSSKIKKRFKADLTIKRTAKDIGLAIRYLGLDKQDFVLFGSSYCGGIVLQGLLDKTLNAPTIVVFDPFIEWAFYKNWIRAITVVPSFVIGILRMVLANIILAGMKNQTQRERVIDFVKGSTPWKWRKSSLQNFKFNIKSELPKIEEEIFLFHGPFDRHHPDEIFEEITKDIPKGRYIYMPTEEEKREMLNGVIGLEFAKVTKKEKLPKSLAQFEINLKREK